MREPKSKQRKATPKEKAVAHYLLGGDRPSVACRKAGYKESVVRTRAAKIARKEEVRQAMLEIKSAILPNEIGDLAEAALHQDLLNLPQGSKHAKARLGFERTGLEFAGRLGGPSELHLHQHQHQFPPQVQRMLAEMMLKLQKEQEAASPGPAETGITSPAEVQNLLVQQIEPLANESLDDPVGTAEPRLSLEEKQNRYLSFQASLVQNRQL